MNILDEIIRYKAIEVAERKALRSTKQLEQSEHVYHPVISLKASVSRPGATGIIAEFKRKSPSKGVINATAPVEQTTQGYREAGASAVSVLTDAPYFGGSSDDLIAVRSVNNIPILRKDFIVDEYQILEARAMGADAILLIAAALPPKKIRQLAAFAQSINLEVLLEVHTEQELESSTAVVDLIGVNNRDLKTFTTDLAISKRLAPRIPKEIVRVSESGIEDPNTILELRNYGYQGFLMGQNFMQHEKPEEACRQFITALRNLNC